ncbi:hypothetical protein BDV30DRAFT_218128 [Aspergillus minisclerotigenes]|uniref:Secreted protein n=1 Tax=Aspergillus minisclerotigenes TaxID=656917 RepID=A0A5N6IPL9_9EURO|nr:hypothetical protein BDV30DRAFT_218128 [Aspergillus minisclerotigenes]
MCLVVFLLGQASCYYGHCSVCLTANNGDLRGVPASYSAIYIRWCTFVCRGDAKGSLSILEEDRALGERDGDYSMIPKS